MNDQAILVMFPIVGLSILAGIAGIYFVWKERREDREQPTADRRD